MTRIVVFDVLSTKRKQSAVNNLCFVTDQLIAVEVQ